MKRRFLGFALGVAAVLSASGADGDKAFEYDFGRPLQTAPAVDHDGTIYVGGSGAVAAVSSTGAELWKTELSTDSESRVNFITIGENQLFVTSEEGLFALTKDGSKVWTNQVNTSTSAVALGQDGNLFVATVTGQLLSLTPEGEPRWTNQLDVQGFQVPPPSIGPDGTIYIRHGFEHLSAFKPDGELRWSEALVGGQPHSLPVTEAGEVLILDGDGSSVHAVGSSGEISWSIEGNAPSVTEPSIGPNGDLYLLPHPFSFGNLVAYDSEGNFKWFYSAMGGTPPLVTDNGTIIVATETQIVALNAEGHQTWTYTPSGQVFFPMNVGIDNTILLVQNNGKLLGLTGSSPLAQKGWPTRGGDGRHSFHQRTPVTVSLLAPSSIGETSVQLHAEIDPAGRAAEAFFEYTKDGVTVATAPEPLSSTTGLVAFSQEVSGLMPGSWYSVRAVLSNAFEVVRSSSELFQTAGGGGEIEPTLEALQGLAQSGGSVKFTGSGVISLQSPLVFLADAELDANGHTVVLSGQGETSIIRLGEGVSLTLKGIALFDGRAEGTYAAPDTISGGGAILNDGGNLTITSCVFSNNVALGAVGAPGAMDQTVANAAGGAIWQRGGFLAVEASSFLANGARGGSGFTFSGIGKAEAGAMWVEGAAVQIADSRFEGNSSVAGFGGAYQVQPGPASGGALFLANCTTVLDSVVIVSNSCSGSTSYGIEANGLGGAICVTAGALTITNAVLEGNSAAGGRTGVRGGGSGSRAYGGALYSEAVTRIYNSSFVGNSGLGGLSDPWNSLADAAGGAIYNAGTLQIVNSTFTRNQALKRSTDSKYPFELGSASAIYNTGTATVTNATIAGNTGSSFAVSGKTQVLLKNTLLAQNVGTARYPGRNADSIQDAGHNLSSDDTPAFTEPTSANHTNARLGPIGSYGGDTPVYPLLAGSPAIDAADDSAAPDTDQRGRTRPHGAHADIGAFESSSPFYVWGTIQGPHDSSTEMTIGTEVVVPDEVGYFDLGPLPEGITEIAVTATNTVFRPNPWELDVTVDGPVNDLYAFELHTFAFDDGYEVPVFTLAGEEGETYLIEGSHDLESWSPVDTYTVDPTGLISVQVTNEAKLFLRATGE